MRPHLRVVPLVPAISENKTLKDAGMRRFQHTLSSHTQGSQKKMFCMPGRTVHVILVPGSAPSSIHDWTFPAISSAGEGSQSQNSQSQPTRCESLLLVARGTRGLLRSVIRR